MFLQIYITSTTCHCLGYISKFVKSLQSQLWPVNFTNFSSRVFGGFLTIGPSLMHLKASCPNWTFGQDWQPKTNWPSRYSAHLSSALQNRWDCEVSESVSRAPRYLARMVKQSTLWITTLFNKFETHYPFVKFIIISIGCWIFPELTHYFSRKRNLNKNPKNRGWSRFAAKNYLYTVTRFVRLFMHWNEYNKLPLTAKMYLNSKI